MFYFMIEATPRPENEDAQDVNGAYVNCWSDFKMQAGAEAVARHYIEDAGWIARRAVAVLGLLEVYTHAAADTRRMEPEHDICWAQPTSYLRTVLVAAVEGWSDQGASSIRCASG